MESLIKQILFFEKVREKSRPPNHSLRPLDQSWRLREPKNREEKNIRDAVLFGRVRPSKSLDTLAPTTLLLGENTNLEGTITQDTFIRVLLPLRPGEN